jgi:hypothetical protein
MHYKVSPELGVVEIGSARYDYKKVREHFGKDLCWARALSVLPNVDAACPYRGTQGHKKGDSLHTGSVGRRDYFLRNIAAFALPDSPSTSMQVKSAANTPYKTAPKKVGN